MRSSGGYKIWVDYRRQQSQYVAPPPRDRRRQRSSSPDAADDEDKKGPDTGKGGGKPPKKKRRSKFTFSKMKFDEHGQPISGEESERSNFNPSSIAEDSQDSLWEYAEGEDEGGQSVLRTPRPVVLVRATTGESTL